SPPTIVRSRSLVPGPSLSNGALSCQRYPVTALPRSTAAVFGGSASLSTSQNSSRRRRSPPKTSCTTRSRISVSVKPPWTASVDIVQPLNATVDLVVQSLGGTLGRPLALVDGRAADVPNTALSSLAASAAVTHVAFDRATSGMMERTAATVGALAVRNDFGYNG